MKIYLVTLSCNVFFGLFSLAQGNHSKAFQFTLEQDEIGKEIIFNQANGKGIDSLVLVYLGDIKTEDDRILKIITSRWYWGSAPRATSRVIIFNQKNQYLGDYYLTMTYDIPDRIEGTFLVFTNKKESDCRLGLISKVSFKKGIPKQFFLKCRDTLGDIYSFEQNL